jgi:hypothetical protein
VNAVVSTTTLVGWNFPNDPDDTIADIGISINLNKIIQTQGTNLASTSYIGATTSSARATGWNLGANIKYWVIEFNSIGYKDLQIYSKQRSSNAGPKDFKIQYKIGDDGLWLDIPGGSIIVADNWTGGVVNNLSLPSETSNQESVFIRWIMTSNDKVNPSGGVDSAGASNIDDILITGVISEVSKTTPIITWDNPTDIEYGMSLSEIQLNATTTVDGTFAYLPDIGTVLSVGSGQVLSTTFTPIDSINFNIATSSVLINVVDTTPPVITVLGENPIKIKRGTTYIDAGATSTDNLDGDLTASIAISGNVKTDLSGTYAITYSVTDSSGNFSSTTRNVTVYSSGGRRRIENPPVEIITSLVIENSILESTSTDLIIENISPVIVETSTMPISGEVLGVSIFVFNKNLRLGDRNGDVFELQKRLTDEGLFTASITGYFGITTKNAVIKYQEKYASEILAPLGLTKGTGFVGIYTRGKLNQ